MSVVVRRQQRRRERPALRLVHGDNQPAPAPRRRIDTDALYERLRADLSLRYTPAVAAVLAAEQLPRRLKELDR